ncbi:MAG: biotin--[acetyl-CoA-carboxylase] ligase [Spirosomataceae bacterium]
MHNFQPNTLFVGKNFIYLPTCHSTNDIAAQKIQQGDDFEGTVILTSHQTAGRGQRGNTWETEADANLTFSLILRPTFLRPTEQFRLNIAVSLAVYECFSPFLEESLRIKWPNDIYVGNRKMGGILIENLLQSNAIGYSIIGIGLNINQLEFQTPTATSLRRETGQPFRYELEPLLNTLLISLEKNYLQLKNSSFDSLKVKYLSILFRYQEYHYFRRNGKVFLGQIVGIDEMGRLAVETDGYLEYFDLKEIEFVIEA